MRRRATKSSDSGVSGLVPFIPDSRFVCSGNSAANELLMLPSVPYSRTESTRVSASLVDVSPPQPATVASNAAQTVRAAGR